MQLVIRPKYRLPIGKGSFFYQVLSMVRKIAYSWLSWMESDGAIGYVFMIDNNCKIASQ